MRGLLYRLDGIVNFFIVSIGSAEGEACLPKLRLGRICFDVIYVFGPAKNITDQTKHGVSLALAEVLFAGPRVMVSDDRFDYGETREIAFGLIQNRLFGCVYADREPERRIISLRKANKREVLRYGGELEQSGESRAGGDGLG